MAFALGVPKLPENQAKSATGNDIFKRTKQDDTSTSKSIDESWLADNLSNRISTPIGVLKSRDTRRVDVSMGLLSKKTWRKPESALQRELVYDRCDFLQLRGSGGSVDGRFCGPKRKNRDFPVGCGTRVKD